MRATPFAATLILAWSVSAQGTAAPDRVHPINGDAIDGELIGIDASGKVQVRDAAGKVHEHALDMLRRVDFGREAATPPEQPPTLWLRSGQRLPAKFVAGTGAAGKFTLPWASGEVQFAWRHVAAVRFAGAATPAEAFERRLTADRNPRDSVFALRDGSVRMFSMQVLGIGAGGVRVQLGADERELPTDRLYGVVFADGSGAPPDRQPNPRVRLNLGGGGHVDGQLVSLDGDRCKLKTAEGVELDVQTRFMTGLQVFSDRLVFLREFEPKVEQTPAFDTVWPMHADRGPDGGPIRIGNKTYGSGYVMVPRTRLTFQTDGRFDVCEATIGMEASAGTAAHAVFRVIADGKVVFESDPVTRTSPPIDISVPIAKAKQLTLEADFGKNFDLGDVCVFAMPRVLKK